MRAQLHLLWEVPLQALGLRQSGVRLPLTVAICCVPQLEAICGQGKLWIKLSVTPRWRERPGRARVSVTRVVGYFKFALMSVCCSTFWVHASVSLSCLIKMGNQRTHFCFLLKQSLM